MMHRNLWTLLFDLSRPYHGLMEPILRMDADVEVNEGAIQLLIDEALALQQGINAYYLFSGWYKGPYSSNEDCPANSHAVRQQWLVRPELRCDPSKFELVEGADAFLRDLGEVGATQVAPEVPLSDAGEELKNRRHHKSLNRHSAQVVPGLD